MHVHDVGHGTEFVDGPECAVAFDVRFPGDKEDGRSAYEKQCTESGLKWMNDRCGVAQVRPANACEKRNENDKDDGQQSIDSDAQADVRSLYRAEAFDGFLRDR